MEESEDNTHADGGGGPTSLPVKGVRHNPHGEPEHLPSTSTPIKCLSKACHDAFRILELQERQVNMNFATILNEAKGRFKLWTDDFPGCQHGTLDVIVIRMGDIYLQEGTCIALLSVLNNLRQLVGHRK